MSQGTVLGPGNTKLIRQSPYPQEAYTVVKEEACMLANKCNKTLTLSWKES